VKLHWVDTGGNMTEAREYYDSLIATGYFEQEALTFTQQHFPEFQLTTSNEKLFTPNESSEVVKGIESEEIVVEGRAPPEISQVILTFCRDHKIKKLRKGEYRFTRYWFQSVKVQINPTNEQYSTIRILPVSQRDASIPSQIIYAFMLFWVAIDGFLTVFSGVVLHKQTIFWITIALINEAFNRHPLSRSFEDEVRQSLKSAFTVMPTEGL
jgi:hypothetical protein